METKPILPNYEIIKKLGQGSYGSVYKAKQISTGRKVAIKEIHFIDKSDYHLNRHSLMVARELYLLAKLSKIKNNGFTIHLLDVFVNPEAHEDYSLLNTLYLITSYQKLDLS